MKWLICILSLILILDNLLNELMEKYHRQKNVVYSGTVTGNMPVFSRDSYFSGMTETDWQDPKNFRMLTLCRKRSAGTQRKRVHTERRHHTEKNVDKYSFTTSLVKRFHGFLTGEEPENTGADTMGYYTKTI